MGYVRDKNRESMCVELPYNGKGKAQIRAWASTSITSGWLCDYYLTASGYAVTPITSGSLKKCYAEETLTSGERGVFTFKGYCEAAHGTGGTSTSFTAGNTIAFDTGLVDNGAPSSAPSAGFGVIISSNEDSSSTGQGLLVDVFLDNDMNLSTG